MQAKVPMMQPILASIGPGLSKEKPIEAGSYPNPFVMVYDWTEADFAYQTAKMVHELWPVYNKAPAPGIEQFDPARRIYQFAIPYHDGAIRFYKEIGKWTDADQKHNDSVVKRQQLLKSTWDKAVVQAAEQKVKADAFAKFWKNLRLKALKDAGLDVYYTE